MAIYGIKEFLERRATGTLTSPQIQQLEAAAVAAIATGDTDAAAAFQRAADALRSALVSSSIAYSPPKEVKEEKDKDGKPIKAPAPKIVPPGVIAMQWAALAPTNLHASRGTCLLDCGGRGTITITPTGISLTGSLANDPIAILLSARHAQLHWDSACKIAGSDEFKFNVAVAGKMLGVKTRRAHVPFARRSEARDLADDWRPVLSSITGVVAPPRPGAPRATIRPPVPVTA
jgi:hypothetical protein